MSDLLEINLAQLVGATIILTALIQAASVLFCSWRKTVLRKTHEELSGHLLQNRTAITALKGQVQASKEQLPWSGFRKFRVNRKVKESEDTCSVYLMPHDGKTLPRFQPGQYLTFSLHLPDREKPVIRCYSLSDSALLTNYYRVTIKRVKDSRDGEVSSSGLSSSFFHDVLSEGDILDVKAPSGRFFIDLSSHTPVVMIAGGIGITPMISMINTLCDMGSKREVWLFYGVRDNTEQIMLEHLTRLEADNENLHVSVNYSNSATNIDRADTKFRQDGKISVNSIMQVLPAIDCDYYLCGPAPLLGSITKGLRDYGIPEKDIHTETFGPASVKTASSSTKNGRMNPKNKIKINFSKSQKTLEWDNFAGSILEFADINQINIESGCRAGSCGTCITAIKTGEVSYLEKPDTPSEKSSCLTCIAVPKTNLTIDA